MSDPSLLVSIGVAIGSGFATLIYGLALRQIRREYRFSIAWRDKLLDEYRRAAGFVIPDTSKGE